MTSTVSLTYLPVFISPIFKNCNISLTVVELKEKNIILYLCWTTFNLSNVFINRLKIQIAWHFISVFCTQCSLWRHTATICSIMLHLMSEARPMLLNAHQQMSMGTVFLCILRYIKFSIISFTYVASSIFRECDIKLRRCEEMPLMKVTGDFQISLCKILFFVHLEPSIWYIPSYSYFYKNKK